jgi:hypothetical protein
MKQRLGYVEWMQKINSTYQAPHFLEQGLTRLVNSEPSQIPSGVAQPQNLEI